MSTSITDYVCNLIAGSSQITNLYYAVDTAKVQQNRSLQFCYKVSFKGIGTKMYKGPELVRLENKSLSCSLAQLEIQLNLAGRLTLDQFIVFLLYARNTIQNLYQMRNNALYMHSAIKVFCYTFVNPFGELAQVSSNKLSFKSARSFSTFFDTCLCNSKNFDPTKIISGQLSGNLQKIIFGDQPDLAPGIFNSISLSSDGNTLAVGENSFPSFGRVQVYTRNGSSWSLQASLTGSGSIGPSPNQGFSTSLSSDGNTLAVGGINDDSGIGATWIFVRSGGSWSEQAKLVGSSVIGLTSNQGSFVSLSSNGNTLAVGGLGDNSGVGATWVFVRSGSSWSEQTKLIGTGNIGTPAQGTSVSLSDNGNTLAVGGLNDNTDFGATWIFTRSGSVWTQQTKISGPIASFFGKSVSLSADGNIIAIGAQSDDSNIGSTYIYNRTGNTWNQEVKLVGTNSVGPSPNQGFSVSLSGSGSLVAIGGPFDGTNIGKGWVFQKKNGVWTQLYLLENPVAPNPPLSGNLFGFALGLSKDGTTLAIAGPVYNSATGFVAIYI